MMVKYVKLISLCIVFMYNALCADTSKIIVKVRGQSIDIQAPPGYHEISRISPSTKNLVERVIMPTNRLLALFVSEEDMFKILKGEPPSLNKYIHVQCSYELENISDPIPVFNGVVYNLKENYGKLVEQIENYKNNHLNDANILLTKEYGINVKLKYSDEIPTETIRDTQNSFSYIIFSHANHEINGKKINNNMITSNSCILINNAILYIFMEGRHESINDVVFIKKTTNAFIDSIMSSNATFKSRFENTITSIKNFILFYVFNKIVGGIIVSGITVLVVFWVIKLNRSSARV